MRRRSVLRALFGTAGVSGLAGCNALSDTDSTATPSATAPSEPPGSTRASDPSEGGPGSNGTGPAAREPYRATGVPPLERPRGVNVRNLGSTERFLTVVVRDGETEVFAASTAVPAGETASFRRLLASEGRYDVLVETADGARDSYRWDLRADLDDLWVDLVPALSFRRPVVCLTDCPFVVDAADQSVAYDVPDDVDVAAALGRTPAVALDNDGPARRRVTLHVWDGGRLHFASEFDLPPDVRLLVPTLPASQRYGVVVRTPDGEAIYDWLPAVRGTLYASVAAAPEFRCGYADHDVQVRNETDQPRAVRVRVFTGEETLFERTFELDSRAVETDPSAVDPAGPLRFEVETDGAVERYNWVRCAPNGPITVAVSDDGVSVSVRPTTESS